MPLFAALSLLQRLSVLVRTEFIQPKFGYQIKKKSWNERVNSVRNEIKKESQHSRYMEGKQIKRDQYKK